MAARPSQRKPWATFAADFFTPPLSTSTLARLTRELAMLYQAGVRTIQGLELIADKNRSLRPMLRRMAQAIRGGATFADAMRQQGRRWPPMHLGLVAVGERSGTLVEVLRQLARYYETKRTIQYNFLRQLTYPASVVFAAAFIIPVGAKAGDIWVTGGGWRKILDFLVYSLSSMAVTAFVVSLAAVILSRLGVFRFLHNFMGRYIWPFNRYFTKLGVAHFTRALSLMVNCGIGPESSIHGAAAATGIPAMKRAALRAIPLLREGRPMHEALREAGFLSETELQMIYIGEQSGELGEMLRRISEDNYENIRHRLLVWASCAEGLAILLIGLLIIFSYRPG